MKNIILLVLTTALIAGYSCKKGESDRFRLLTGRVWVADSLLVNGLDATGPGGLLENFVGDAKFNEDGTGTFGDYSGSWMFNVDETQLIIETESLPIAITAEIVELTSTSLKVTASIPNPLPPPTAFSIRMTFKPK